MSGIRFERTAPVAPQHPVLDAGQRAVVELADGVSAAVLGAPGSGKTTTIVELVADRVAPVDEGGRGWSPDWLVVLAPSRAAATRLRDRLALRIGVPSNGPLARTVSSLAFELVGAAARAAGAEPPRLVTAAEQDADIAAILEGHLEGGGGPSWPGPLDPAVRRLRGFRTELRELMARATEYDVSPARLRVLGRATGREAWVAAADFIDEYLGIVASSRAAQLDPAELARFAVAAVRDGRPDDRVARLRLVVVDDLQEATESTLALLRALSDRGVAVIAFGDPDVAANAFRGGEPDALGRLGAVLGDPELRQFVLPTVYRQPGPLRALTNAVIVEGRIGTAAAGTQRQASAAVSAAASTGAGSTPPVPLARIEATSPAREWAAVARLLREEHLGRDVPWNQLAVIVRSSAHAPGIARALALAEVPTRTASGGVALRDETAARSLLGLVEVGVGRTELTGELAAELLLSPFGGLDALALRRLRLALRAEELAGDGLRTSEQLLVEALSAPGRFATIDSRPARQAEQLAQTLAALRTSDGSIEDLLWLAWDRSRLAKPWHDQALGSGPVAAEANRDLDAIVALFTAAKRFAERRPDAPASEFLAEVLDAEVPEDVLAPSRGDDAVLVTTPSGAVGLEFRTVVVAALQDGVWPNLRARGSLLQPQKLLRALGADDPATIDDRKLVLDDELRMFALAVSRASERVVLAAVANDDEQRSVFFSLLPPGTPLIDSSTRPPLSLRGFTGRLRRILADPRSNRADAAGAAASLAALARLGLPGAGPDDWHGLEPISSTGPLFEGDSIPVSPSRVERLEESPLDWFLETIAGGDSGVVAGVGTILHWAMETVDDPVVENLWGAVESRWGELVFESPWLAERQRGLARIFTQALADYLADFRRDGKSLVAAEGRFRLEYGEVEGAEPRDDGTARPAIVVSGSIDRVERGPDGEVVIVDLKTGRPITSAKVIAEHPQLGAYQLAYAEGKFDEALEAHGGHRPGGAKLLYVREGKDGRRYRDGHQATLDAEALDAVRERIRQAAVLIAAAEFEGKLELDAYRGFGTTPRLRLHRVKAVSSD